MTIDEMYNAEYWSFRYNDDNESDEIGNVDEGVTHGDDDGIVEDDVDDNCYCDDGDIDEGVIHGIDNGIVEDDVDYDDGYCDDDDDDDGGADDDDNDDCNNDDGYCGLDDDGGVIHGDGCDND